MTPSPPVKHIPSTSSENFASIKRIESCCNCSVQETGINDRSQAGATIQQNIILASLQIELLTPKICCHVPLWFPLIISQATPFCIIN
eukprot:Em0003g1222a